jgi:hypothetical protein
MTDMSGGELLVRAGQFVIIARSGCFLGITATASGARQNEFVARADARSGNAAAAFVLRFAIVSLALYATSNRDLLVAFLGSSARGLLDSPRRSDKRCRRENRGRDEECAFMGYLPLLTFL